MASDTEKYDFGLIQNAYSVLSDSASARTDGFLSDMVVLKDYLQEINDSHDQCIGGVTLGRIDVDQSDSYVQDFIEANSEFDSLYSGLSTACSYSNVNSGGSVSGGSSGGSGGAGGYSGDYTINPYTPISSSDSNDGYVSRDYTVEPYATKSGLTSSTSTSPSYSSSSSSSPSYRGDSTVGSSGGFSSRTSSGGNIHTGAAIGTSGGAISSLVGGLGGSGGGVHSQINYPLGNYNVNSSFINSLPKNELTNTLKNVGFSDDEINAIMNGEYDVSNVLVDEVSEKLAAVYKDNSEIRDYLKEQYGFDIFNEDGSVNNDRLSLALYMDDKSGLDNYSIISELSNKYGVSLVDQNILSNYTKEFESMFMKNSNIRNLFKEKFGFDVFNSDGTINKDRLTLAMLLDKKSSGELSIEQFLKEVKSSDLVNSLGNDANKFISGIKEKESNLPYIAGAAAVGGAAIAAGIVMNKKKEKQNENYAKDGENRFIISDFKNTNENYNDSEYWVNKAINDDSM